MIEQEPRPHPEALTEQEAQDTALMWERMGSGKPLETTTDTEHLKEQMWQGVQEAWVEKVIPNLRHFKLDEDLEQKIETATTDQDKADLQLELARKYKDQLFQEEAGWGTTPALSEQTNWSLDCVGTSAVMAIALDRAGIEVNSGTVFGHKVVVMKDAIGRKWYVDSRNENPPIVEIPTTGEQEGKATVHKFTLEQSQTMKIVYSALVERPLKEGFLDSMLGNINVLRTRSHISESKPATELERVYEANKDVLELQNWDDICQKMVPDSERLHKYFDDDESRLKLQEESDRVVEQVLVETLGEDDDQQARRKLMRDTFTEALPNRDGVLAFLSSDEAPLPEGLSDLIVTVLHKLKEGLTATRPEVRMHLLQRITDQLH